MHLGEEVPLVGLGAGSAFLGQPLNGNQRPVQGIVGSEQKCCVHDVGVERPYCYKALLLCYGVAWHGML